MLCVIPVIIDIGGGVYWGFNAGTNAIFEYSGYFDASYEFEYGVEYADSNGWQTITPCLDVDCLPIRKIESGASFLDNNECTNQFRIDISPYFKINLFISFYDSEKVF